MEYIIFLLLDICQIARGVTVFGNPIRNPFIRRWNHENSAACAFVLDKKRSAFYFHESDGAGKIDFAMVLKNA